MKTLKYSGSFKKDLKSVMNILDRFRPKSIMAARLFGYNVLAHKMPGFMQIRQKKFYLCLDNHGQ